MTYESEMGIRVDDPSASRVDQFLGQLEGVDESYASLTDDAGNYVQVGGGPDEFTVERRENRPDGTFRHFKATRREPRPEERVLAIGGASVKVRANQVLDLASVRRLFRAFAEGRGADPAFDWHDMTAMFHDGT